MPLDRKRQCHDDLKRRVLTLDLAPGTVLDETEVSKLYALSRTPLREVFQRLAFEGYLQIQSKRGTTVSSMDLDTMRNFFQTAPIIYTTAARLAAQNATRQQIDELKATQLDFERTMRDDDAAGMAVLNHRFHELIGEMSGSIYLSPSLNRLLIDHTRMSQRFYRPRLEESKGRIEKASKQHNAMIKAIENRDGEKIADLTKRHWELSRGQIEKYSHPDPLPIDRDLEHRNSSFQSA